MSMKLEKNQSKTNFKKTEARSNKGELKGGTTVHPCSSHLFTILCNITAFQRKKAQMYSSTGGQTLISEMIWGRKTRSQSQNWEKTVHLVRGALPFKGPTQWLGKWSLFPLSPTTQKYWFFIKKDYLKISHSIRFLGKWQVFSPTHNFPKMLFHTARRSLKDSTGQVPWKWKLRVGPPWRPFVTAPTLPPRWCLGHRQGSWRSSSL